MEKDREMGDSGGCGGRVGDCYSEAVVCTKTAGAVHLEILFD